MKRYYMILLLVLFSAVLVPLVADAQYAIPHATFTNGGGSLTGSNRVFSSAGQWAISSVLAGGAYCAFSGFWHQASVTSTVDVAITSFAGMFRQESVILSWSVAASAPFHGFHIYRSEDGPDDLARLNGQIIDPGVAEYYDETAIPGRTYSYWLGAVDAEGERLSAVISVSLPPRPAAIYQNYPNPFNPVTSIEFFNPKKDHVALCIYDVKGRRVRTLLYGEKDAGRFTISWNGEDDNGRQVQSGVYYCQLVAGKERSSRKMVMLR